MTAAILLLLFGRRRRLPAGAEGVTVVEESFRVQAVESEYACEPTERRFFVEAL
jgi:hypothetical protein